MSDYRYPSAEVQFISYFGSSLGTFCRDYYKGPPSLDAWMEVMVREHEQSHDALNRLFECSDRKTIPSFRRHEWFELTVSESDLGTGTQVLPKYGPAYAHGTEIFFGQAVTANSLTFEVPTTLKRCPLLASNVGEVRAWLVEGIDYRFDVENSYIELSENLFDDSRFAVENVFENGEISDRTLTLYAYGSEHDEDTLYRQFGYVYRMKLPSGDVTRDLLNAVADAAVHGSSELLVRQVWSAATGCPLAKHDEETVEEIGEDQRGQFLLTDKEFYRLPMDSTPAVAVGDTVVLGDSLCEELSFTWLNRGVAPSYLDGLSMGRGFLPSYYWGDLYFANERVPLVVEEDVDGKTKASFQLEGHPGDVELFWDEVHQRGVSSGTTLANLLDLRPTPTEEPRAGNLPATINPLEFLVSNLLRFNVLLVNIALPNLGEGAVGLHAMRWLRQVLPPDLCVIVLSSRQVTETVTPDNITESVEAFTTTVAEDTVDAATYVQESVRLRNISGRCV